jgi:hypothetical protein
MAQLNRLGEKEVVAIEDDQLVLDPDGKMKQMSDLFNLTMDTAARMWGELAFRRQDNPDKPGAISKSLLDSVGVALSQLNEKNRKVIHEAGEKAGEAFHTAHNKALLDIRYESSISRSTKDVGAVQMRFDVARRCLAWTVNACGGKQSLIRGWDGAVVPPETKPDAT